MYNGSAAIPAPVLSPALGRFILLAFFGMTLAAVLSGNPPEPDRDRICKAFTIGVSAVGTCDGFGGPALPL